MPKEFSETIFSLSREDNAEEYYQHYAICLRTDTATQKHIDLIELLANQDHPNLPETLEISFHQTEDTSSADETDWFYLCEADFTLYLSDTRVVQLRDQLNAYLKYRKIEM